MTHIKENTQYIRQLNNRSIISKKLSNATPIDLQTEEKNFQISTSYTDVALYEWNDILPNNNLITTYINGW